MRFVMLAMTFRGACGCSPDAELESGIGPKFGKGPMGMFFNGYEDFGDPGQKWLRMARRMAQKAIRRLLSRSRWSPTDLIFDGFEPGSECHFFQKSELRELKFRDFELSKNGPETS